MTLTFLWSFMNSSPQTVLIGVTVLEPIISIVPDRVSTEVAGGVV
jgi:hypothetical protein